MAHFAKVVDGVVTQVIVAEPEFFNTFVDSSPGEWVQTSYNTRGGIHYNPETQQPSNDQSKALRKNYAGIGFTYDKVRDAFIPPKPYSKWILNEQSCTWEAPTQRPNDSDFYNWDDNAGQWVLASTPEGM